MTDGIDMRQLYAMVEAELDGEYVRDVALWVARSLRVGLPIGAAFQPGDGTRYDLVFLPVQGLQHAPGRVVRGEPWPAETDFGISREPGTAFVAWYRNGSSGFDFRSGGFEPIYLGEIFDTTAGSACTIAVLFNAIADAFGG